jgi:ABC-type multidrug transport system fused ATPase/permease subunit
MSDIIRLILTKSEKKKLIIIFFGSLLLSLSEVFSVGIIIPIIGLFVNQERMRTSAIYNWFCQLTGIQDIILFLNILIIAAITIFILKSIYSIFIVYKQNIFVGRIFNRITTMLLNSYLRKPYAFHLENNSAILFKNITAEVGNFTSGFLKPILLISTEIIVISGIFVFLMWTYPKTTFLLFCFFGIIFILIHFFLNKRIQSYSIQREESYNEFYKSGMEGLSGVKEIQIYNVHTLFLERFSKGIKKYTNSFVKFTVVSVVPRHILESTLFAAILLGILISVYINENHLAIIPMMAVLGIAALRILPSISKIYTNINILQYFSNSADIVHKILKEDATERELETVVQGTVSDSEKSSSITQKKSMRFRLEGLEFQYKTAASPIFKDLNLVIPLNKTVAFVGETGAGKSTLIDILMGLLTPSSGVLYYDKLPITRKNVIEYRKKIGYVPQQIFLSDDTLEANIAFGIPEDKIDVKQLKHVLKMSHLDLFVSELPQGTKTFIGEKGVKISGGQRQRIGIARALYRNPEILILDEATSSLDGYTESEISNDIIRLGGNLTIIIVAHRLSTIEHADIIYVLDKGKIVDQGTFDVLMENSAIFQKIANQQVPNSI